MSLIKGTEGSITSNGIPTGFISTFSVEYDSKSKEAGPFIGNSNIYSYATSSVLTGSLEGVIPVGKDPGQTEIITKALTSQPVSLVLVTTGGYTISVPSGTIDKMSIEQNAEELITITADFKSNGGYTIS